MFLYPEGFEGKMHPYFKLQVFKGREMVFETPSWPLREENEKYLDDMAEDFIIKASTNLDDVFIKQREVTHVMHVYTRVK